jgi:hypothetical protein
MLFFNCRKRYVFAAFYSKYKSMRRKFKQKLHTTTPGL